MQTMTTILIKFFNNIFEEKGRNIKKIVLSILTLLIYEF